MSADRTTTWSSVRKAIADSIHDARYEHKPFTAALDLAATRVMNLVSQARSNEVSNLESSHVPLASETTDAGLDRWPGSRILPKTTDAGLWYLWYDSYDEGTAFITEGDFVSSNPKLIIDNIPYAEANKIVQAHNATLQARATLEETASQKED